MTASQHIQPVYLHPQKGVNDTVTLHTGPAVLRDGKTKQASCTAHLFLQFLPSAALRLELDLTTDDAFRAFEPAVAEVYGPEAERRADLARLVRAIMEETAGVVDVGWPG